MMSADADLRRRQIVGLIFIAVLVVAAVGTGVFLGALWKGHASATSVLAFLVWASIAVSTFLGVLGAWVWSRAGQADMMRHPEGNVARNRLVIRRDRPRAR
jgi:membrane protein implicated in regulation of membrane protease activity